MTLESSYVYEKARQYRLRYGCALIACAVALHPVATPRAMAQATIPAAQALSPEEQQFIYNFQVKLLQAVDTGDSATLQGLINYARSLDTVWRERLNLNFIDQAGNTPLIRAGMQNNPDIVRILVENGARLNAVNQAGQSALFMARYYGHDATAHALLNVGTYDSYKAPIQAKKVADSGTFWTPAATGITAAAVAAGGIGIAAAASGGGGGDEGSNNDEEDATPAGTTHPAELSPSSLRTAEAQAQEGFLAIKSEYALARGYDGSIYDRNIDGSLVSTTPTGYVKVAVMDSGVDLSHSDLSPNVASGSVTCTGASCTSGGLDVEGHGTHVAGIIAAARNDTGILGVASQSKFISIGVLDNAGQLTAGADVLGIKYAIDNGVQVINSSFGTEDILNYSSAQITSDLNATYAGTSRRAQYQNMVTNHVINVFAAGNDGDANPGYPGALPYYFQGATAPSGLSQSTYDSVNPGHYDWSNNWVVVVSVDSNNTISSFSNRCGIAKEWCLAAPGENLTTTENGGGVTTGNYGTSFAAPNVTGAVAVMLGAFPQLTPERVLEILFATADDLGTTGVDDIYGHGLVNLDKATDPTEGGWTLTSLSGARYAIETSGFSLSAPFGNALSGSAASLQFLDGYGKNYTINLTSVGQELTRSRTAFERMDRNQRGQLANTLQIDDTTSLQFGMEQKAASDIPGDAQEAPQFAWSTTFAGQDGSSTSLGFNYRTNLAYALMPEEQKALPDDTLKNPYLTLADKTTSSIVNVRSGEGSITIAGYQGQMDNDVYSYRYDTEKNVTGTYTELGYHGVKNAVISVNGGVNIEQDSLLGSEASGAFGIDRATTYHSGISARYGLMKDVHLFANYHMGLTKVEASSSSLFSAFSDVGTNAFSLGASARNLRAKSDTLGLVFSQPLRVTQGNASMLLPVGIQSSGSMLYENQSLNLAPTARELDFGAYYAAPIDDVSKFSFDTLLRTNPDNSDETANDLTFFANYSLHF